MGLRFVSRDAPAAATAEDFMNPRRDESVGFFDMSFNSQSGGWDAPDRSTAKWLGFPKSFVSPRVIRNQGKQDKSVQTEFRVSRWEAPVDQQKCYVCPRLIAIQSTRIILKQQISDPRYRASPMSPNGRADGVFRFLAGNRAFRPTRC